MDVEIVQSILPDSRRVPLERCPKVGVLFKVLWDLAGDSCLRREILKHVTYEHPAGSFEMALDMTKTPECGYYFYDGNPMLTKYIMAFAGPGTMIDVGANVGFYSLVGSLAFDHVHAFEPCSATFVRLERNIQLSRKRHVRAHSIGLSSVNETAALRTSPNNTGSNAVVRKGSVMHEAKALEEIQLRTLDEVATELSLSDVGFIKVDVEGHESAVLRGAHETLSRWHPAVFVECHTNGDVVECARALPGGYVPWDVLGGRPTTVDALLHDPERYLDVLFTAEP
jgi:FkbM family methyltransferase